MTILPILYKYDTTGKPRFWTVEVEPETGKWRTVAGVVGTENPVTSEWTQAVGKNEGKANATSAMGQAHKEANALWAKKLKEGYAEDIEKSGANFVEPMLAQKYDIKRLKNVDYVLVQPKLNGIRCTINKTGMFTRTGETIVSCPHLWEAAQPILDVHPDLTLDGELYNHELRRDFNTITSVVRKQKLSFEQLEQSARLIQYHIYDGVFGSNEGMKFSERYVEIKNQIFTHSHPSLKSVETNRISLVDFKTMIPQYHANYVADEYEGLMVRHDLAYDVGKRSWSLMKYKHFMDDEFPIDRFEEGRGRAAGVAKVAICKLPDGREFGATVKGSYDFCKQVMAEQNEYNEATVEFFDYTPDGIPLFPVAAKLYKDGKI